MLHLNNHFLMSSENIPMYPRLYGCPELFFRILQIRSILRQQKESHLMTAITLILSLHMETETLLLRAA